MKRLLRYTALLMLLLVPLALVACGDDDDDGGGSTNVDTSDDGDSFVSSGEIRTSKGLTQAALNAGFGSSNAGSDDGAELVADTGVRSSAGSAGAPAALPAADDSYLPLGGDSTKSSDASALAQAGSGGGITVTGYGTAEADADGGVIEFYFGNNGVYAEPAFPDGDIRTPDGTTGGSITEEDLQPVIDALVGAGVAADDIELVGQGYYDPYYASATLRATVRDINILEAAANAGSEAAAGLGDIALQSTNVTYTLSNCEAMERAALETAAEDAADSAAVLADVLNVGLGAITAASDYSYPYYYPYYGGGEQVCASSYYGAMPFYSGVSLPGDKTVEVFGSISVTYAIS